VTDGRKRLVRALATICIAPLAAGVVVSAPSDAKPDIGSVQARVDRLYHQAEQASERYNNARIQMQHAQARLGHLKSRTRRQQAEVDRVHQQVVSSVLDQYQGSGVSSATRALTSTNPGEFLDQLTAISQFNDQRSEVMANFAAQVAQLRTRQAEAKRELAKVTSTKQRLGRDKAQIDRKAAEAKQLLTRLKTEAAARAADRASRSQDRTTTAVPPAAPATTPATTPAAAAPVAPAPAPTAAPASGRAAAAVAYALSKVGDAYVYGAAGPSAFDCSGLTMMAWRQGGISLPHSSSAQMSSGTPVSESQLQPGDLVFYYSPVSHVGMYIGHGEIVNAENPSVGVKITGVNTMPYAGAVRPG
jgi:peptidoglycan DL-endopeptidase CwlO